MHKLQECGFLVCSVCPLMGAAGPDAMVGPLEDKALHGILEDLGILGLVPANW